MNSKLASLTTLLICISIFGCTVPIQKTSHQFALPTDPLSALSKVVTGSLDSVSSAVKSELKQLEQKKTSVQSGDVGETIHASGSLKLPRIQLSMMKFEKPAVNKPEDQVSQHLVIDQKSYVRESHQTDRSLKQSESIAPVTQEPIESSQEIVVKEEKPAARSFSLSTERLSSETSSRRTVR